MPSWPLPSWRAPAELAYTSLYAPFDALIARRLVENHTTLPPNAEVVRIQDISELRIRINVPEALMQHLDGEHGFNAEAEIATLPGERIALEYREHITEPDEVAQTYQVEFAPAEGEHPGGAARHHGHRVHRTRRTAGVRGDDDSGQRPGHHRRR